MNYYSSIIASTLNEGQAYHGSYYAAILAETFKPTRFYHGTSSEFLPSIKVAGLTPQKNRQLMKSMDKLHIQDSYEDYYLHVEDKHAPAIQWTADVTEAKKFADASIKLYGGTSLVLYADFTAQDLIRYDIVTEDKPTKKSWALMHRAFPWSRLKVLT